jgi:hypothetical protein
MKHDYTEEQILKAAIAAYESNRAFSVALGDRTVVPWEWADDFTKKVFTACVRGVPEGRLPFAEDQPRASIFKAVVTSVLESLVNYEESLPGV